MAKVAKSAFVALTKMSSCNAARISTFKPFAGGILNRSMLLSSQSHNTARGHGTLSSFTSSKRNKRFNCCLACSNCLTCGNKPLSSFYSTEVDKEISSFLEKEIQFESSRASNDMPKIPGFEIVTEGGDITLTKKSNTEKVVIRLSVNGAVDSIAPETPESAKQDEPPQMVCRPPFEVEITKGSGEVLALQCMFPSAEEPFEDAQQHAADADKIEDQFEIQEVAFHNGEWKDSTFAVSAATMDAELFDLLMDMLDERGVNDEFINNLVDYCTAYENKQYINFLKGLKAFADK